MLINNKLEDPYNKMPNDGPLPILSKTLIKSKLSKIFWIKMQYIYDSDSSPNRNIPQEKNIESPNIKTKKNNYNNNININNGNINKNNKNNINNCIKNNINDNIKNSINNIKLKKRKVKTPNMKQRNIRYKDIAQNDNKNNKNNNFNKEDNLENIKSNYKNKLDLLRETAIILESELNENEKIIEIQKEENLQLKNKIQKLTAMLNSIISTDKK